MKRLGAVKWVLLFALAAVTARAGENLKLNPHLDYSSDSQDGPLITGDHMDKGPVADAPNYIIFYGEGCFNSKRQARRTVSLYEKYRGRVQFVIVDMDHKLSPAQEKLAHEYFKGSIPHVVLLDRQGKAVYNAPGEMDEARLAALLDQTLR